MPRPMRRFQLSLACAIAVAMLAVGVWSCYSLYTAERDGFRSAVQVGMLRDEVKAAVGDPDEKLAAGDNLPTWGGTPTMSVAAETWVYFVFPKSQHRFALTFEDSRLAKIDYAAN